ncbi:hypothetical protein [Paraconexibacter algicola]|uniref:ApeA N-terminal domain-containing protein n=1 Tax=Paraconexibacter algicola TaxID=2133960 RepID=A0A2T4UB54_9ACTN|nr:hypothetical protein [Paraconexibacter algicola]PTL54101.1 hypothetical protein C7Y72_22045 [Paraconexibacter algicola]
MSKKDREALLAGEVVVGRFQVIGTEDVVPGVLRWSARDGATLELIDDASGFPRSFDALPFGVHGLLRNGGEVSLFDCRVSRMQLLDHPTHIRCSTLAYGAQVLPEDRWPRAIYGTAALSQWRDDSGIHLANLPSADDPTLRVEFQPTTRDRVDVPGAELVFCGHRDTSPYGHRSDFWSRTDAVMVVNPRRPQTIAALMSKHAQPLRALMALAADRPDDLTREIYVDVDRPLRIEVWRQGRPPLKGEWERRQLFGADQLIDYPKAIRAWWRLHRQVWPALDLLGDHANEGNSFSPGRFLTVFSAIERYAEIRHKTTDLKKLRTYSQLDSSLTGCTNPALDLIGVTRGYVAHFNNVDDARRAQVEDQMVVSTRRVAALMQACLLRNLGIRKGQRQTLLERHYASWPLV